MVIHKYNSLANFERVFIHQWKELLTLRKKVLKRSAPDHIHDLRIALRRFRVVLKLYDYFLRDKVDKKLKKNIKTMMRNLGALRNIDETFAFFQARIHYNDCPKLFIKLTKMRRTELNRVKEKLKSFDAKQFNKLVMKMKRKLNTSTFTKADQNSLLAYIYHTSDDFSKTVKKHIKISSMIKNPALCHPLRITIRKWRYFLEIIAKVLDHDYDKPLTAFKHYQSVLGRINDMGVFDKLCRELSLRSGENKLIETCLVLEKKILLKELTNLIKHHSLLKYKFKQRTGNFN